jgi:hypothetical protein
MNRNIIILAALFLTSCGKQIDTRTPEETRKDHCEFTADLVTKSFSEKMYQEKGLVMIGMGGGGGGEEGHRKIRMLSVTFQCSQAAEIHQARELILECVHIFLEAINSTKGLEPCVTQFPFNYKNVDLTIFFTKKSTLKLAESPLISVVSTDEGILKYKTTREGELKIIKKETYEEALKNRERDKEASHNSDSEQAAIAPGQWPERESEL